MALSLVLRLNIVNRILLRVIRPQGAFHLAQREEISLDSALWLVRHDAVSRTIVRHTDKFRKKPHGPQRPAQVH